MSQEYLKKAIIKYLQNRLDERSDSITICSYFKLPVNISYAALKELEDEGRIIRHNGFLGGWNGNHYYELAEGK